MKESIFMNKWLQWLIVIVGVSFINILISGLLNVPLHPAVGILDLFEARRWAMVTYLIIHDLGEVAKGAYLLRAFGFIEFVKG